MSAPSRVEPRVERARATTLQRARTLQNGSPRPAAPPPRRPTAGPRAARAAAAPPRPWRRRPRLRRRRGGFAASFANSWRSPRARRLLLYSYDATMRAGSSAAPFRMASSGAVLSAFFCAGVGLGWDFRLGLQRWSIWGGCPGVVQRAKWLPLRHLLDDRCPGISKACKKAASATIDRATAAAIGCPSFRALHDASAKRKPTNRG